MTSKKVIVANPTGLHARPASQLVQFCKKFPEKIILKGNGKDTDPKSIIMLLSAGLKKGTELEVVVEGEKATSVLTVAKNLTCQMRMKYIMQKQ